MRQTALWLRAALHLARLFPCRPDFPRRRFFFRLCGRAACRPPDPRGRRAPAARNRRRRAGVGARHGTANTQRAPGSYAKSRRGTPIRRGVGVHYPRGSSPLPRAQQAHHGRERAP